MQNSVTISQAVGNLTTHTPVVILSAAKDLAYEVYDARGPERDPFTLCEVPRFARNDSSGK